MIAAMASLKDFLARSFGRARGESRQQPDRGSVGSGEALLRRKRLKVAVIATMVGVGTAVIGLPYPADEALRLARSSLRMRAVPQDIAMVAIDDATLNELGLPVPTRKEESEIIDRLAEAGVKKIIFDRAHADPETPESDAQFASALERHKGKVWIGIWAGAPGSGTKDPILPLPQFRERAGMASMFGYDAFGLAVEFPTWAEIDGKEHPAISALLADYDGPHRQYRPDLAFNPDTVPTFSYVDVLRGRVGAKELRGKSIIIGQTFVTSSDIHRNLLYGKVPGSKFHVLGAHTLKRGTPIDLAWYPALLVAGIAIFSQALGRRRSSRPLWAAALGLPAIALVFDEAGISIDVVAALIAIGAAAIGFGRIARKYYSAEVDAMTTSALGLDKNSAGLDVYALKIANLAEISEDWTPNELGEFVNTLISYVKGPGEVGDVAFERDALLWFGPRMDGISLERHADGLALMLKTAISHDWQSASSAPALGIDTNYDLPLGQRLKKAMQVAEEAAARGVRFIINDAAHLEARNQRIEIMRVLEKGLRDRSIGVAYQPKIDLATGRIVGAETLIRWRPGGQEFVNPQELVLAAEANDRINELTLLVMETALSEGREAVMADPEFKLAINMSAKSLSNTHLLFEMMTMLGRIGFPAENLTLELTETAKLDDELIVPQIAALKQRGIGLSIDDFGTGQSNLEYLEKLPSSELKIDKKFVQHMRSSEESRAVVRATIEIAHSLGKIVVAEGVESEAEADTLRAMGCDLAQGFLFARAISMPELVGMMGKGRIKVNG